MDEPNAASVALIEGGRVLLIQRAFAPFAGCWTLPGGRREPGESIEDTATREIREELDLTISALRPVLTMGIVHDFHLQVFATDKFEGTLRVSAEIAGYSWLAPPLASELRTTPDLADVLHRAFAALENS